MPTSKNVIFVPGTHPICQVDGKPITRQTEPGGRLYLVGGYPMCALHRLMRLRVRGKLDYRKVFAMNSEAKRVDIDQLVAEEVKSQKENQRVREVAAASQDRAAQIDPRTQLSASR